MGEDLWAPYDAMGEYFAQHAEDGAYNAHYDRPAVLSALGEVDGRRVLDAACGPGIYAEALVGAGAEVSGFDASRLMVELAQRRLGGRADIRLARLGEPLPYPDGSFDLAVCALAIHYAADRRSAFAELYRVIAPGGALVVSTQHPTADWLRKGGSYFDRVLETDVWDSPAGPHPVRFWREPLSDLCAGGDRRRIRHRPARRAPPGPQHAGPVSRRLREAPHRARVLAPAPSQNAPRTGSEHGPAGRS